MRTEMPSRILENPLNRTHRFGDGVPFVIWMLLWLLGAVVAVVLRGSDILRPGLDRMIGRDFTNLWEGGKLVLAGEALVLLQARADPPAGDFRRQYAAVDETAQA